MSGVIWISEIIDIPPGNLDSSFCFTQPEFLMMYSAYKLNKQGDNIQPWRTPFSIWNQSVVPCLVLTVASWPAYRFLRRQIRWSGIPISLRNFRSVVIHTVKDFSLVNEAEAGIKIAGRNINNLRYSYDPTHMSESKEELKSLLMKVKEESQKVG